MTAAAGEGGTSVPRPPADGEIDFSGYSTAQLRELQFTIDPERSPKNYANLLAALERLAVAQPEMPARSFPVRWTRREGLAGSIEALAGGLPFYGAGFIDPGERDVVLGGWHRTWLGVPIQGDRAIPHSRIINVYVDGPTVEFQVTRAWLVPRSIRFRADSAGSAERIRVLLPDAMVRSSADLQAYGRRLREVAPVAWLTPLIVLVNVAVFTAMAIINGTLAGFDVPVLYAWGGNAGPSTIGGEWWRLITWSFLHVDLVHVAINMLVLWGVGRLTERLYGTLAFALLYTLTGVLAGLSSLVWNPTVVAVGASGAIFGVLGAFLAYLVQRRTRVPAAILRGHLIATAVFVLFSLVSGALQINIDNAAHVGGLVAGFALGYVIARPLTEPRRLSLARLGAACAITGAYAGAALFYLGVPAEPTIPQKYMSMRSWYPEREQANIMQWQSLALQAAAGTLSDAQLADSFEADIIPFWDEADARLKEEDAGLTGELKAFALLLADFVRLRREWAHTLVSAVRANDPSSLPDIIRLAEEAAFAQARIARVQSRALLDRGLRPLADSSFANWIRYQIGGWDCVIDNDRGTVSPAPTDLADDGPSAREAAGCRAQLLFMSSDYAGLDALLDEAAASMGDLPDGSSTYRGVLNGLDDLFWKGIPFEQAMTHTSNWRLAVPGSVNAELVETLALINWAYSARGTGFANTVSAQAQQLYQYRNAMAQAGLDESAEAAAGNPLWYSLALRLGRNRSVPLTELLAIFDKGIARFPAFDALEGNMLNILMPRWQGSDEDVEAFIQRRATANGPFDPVTYARLYLRYGLIEDGGFSVVEDALADPEKMYAGVQALLEAYPKSDYLLNLVARFYCIDGDFLRYLAMRPLLDDRPSAAAWQPDFTIAECDKRAAPH